MKVGILGQLLDFRPGFRQAGVSRYIEYLVQALPSASPDTFVLYAGPQSARNGSGEVRLPGLQWSRSWLPTGRPEVRIIWEQAISPALLERDRIDVVHAPVNVAPMLSGRPSVVTVHDLAFRVFPEQYPSFKRRYLDLLTR
ncbi:MAG TPA: glycosyltransferase, partial [Nitrolancea sp.]|nr:glycosyltransferase [Nitrolancea sp.]